MNIADLIALLKSGQDPNSAVIQAAAPGVGDASPAATAAMMPGLTPGGPGPGGTPNVGFPPPPGRPPAPPPPAAPEGAKTPVTNPQPAPESPKAYQSPPDLANMYIQLMKDNRNAAALDSGTALIAAGLSNNLATRQSLIGLAGHGGGAGGAGSHVTSADLINLQKHQQAMKDTLLRRSMLGSLAKQYNLSPEAATALETSGKLDEVIAANHTGHVIKVTDAATGQESLHHAITGKEIAKVGGPKPDATQVVEGPNGPELRNISPTKGFARIGEGAGIKPTEDMRTLDQINKERPADQQLSTADYITSIKRAAPNATNEAILATINKGRPADKQMGMEELVKMLHPGAQTNLYIGPDGTPHPTPQPGYDYERTPDGKIRIGDNGLPIQRAINPKSMGEEAETKVDIAAKEQKAADVVKKEAKERVQAAFAASNVGEAVQYALSKADTPGVSGAFSGWVRNLASIGGTPWETVDKKIKTIDANNVVNALNQMRQASQSGGALGNVTESENKMLASIVASVDPHQETAEFKKGLIRVQAAMEVMAERHYDKPGDENQFKKDLKARIDELSVAQGNKSGVTVKVKPRSP
jgi:hypothetical protein